MIKRIKISPIKQTSTISKTPAPLAVVTVMKEKPEEVTVPASLSPQQQTTVHDDPGVYQQRKIMLSEYKELFSALLRLPDKEVQKKVLNCINAKYRSIETQTDPVEIRELTTEHTAEIAKSMDMECDPQEDQNSSATNTCEENVAHKTQTQKKRKRKRKVSLPQANKESRVAVAQKQQKVKLSQPQELQPDGMEETRKIQTCSHQLKRQCSESSDFCDNSSFVNGILDDIQKEDTKCMDQQCKTFIKDCILAEIPLENGFLPIQDAIVKSQIHSLYRHIFIWKNWKKIDLNDIFTEDGEDLLQLAITHKSFPGIVERLLENGLNPNILDEQGNTALHLAVIHDVDTGLLHLLMKCIDLKLLLALNDDGYTSLHLAIRQDRYILAECMLNAIDERLWGKSFYSRQYDIYETDDKIMKKQFQDYYENVCMQMEVDDENTCVINNHDVKQRLLQAVDMRSGNTALFFAIENEAEHLVHFLLAHLTDPRTENLSGQDCRSFFSEFGKTLNLSLNIDNTMDKVIKLLS